MSDSSENFSSEFVYKLFQEIDRGDYHNAHFSSANVVMTSKEHYSALADAVVTDEQIAKIRALALEEFRQALKWADWNIGCVKIVDETCEKLQEKNPDSRYTRSEL